MPNTKTTEVQRSPGNQCDPRSRTTGIRNIFKVESWIGWKAKEISEEAAKHKDIPGFQSWRLEVAKKGGAGSGQEKSEGKASPGHSSTNKPCWQHIWHCWAKERWRSENPRRLGGDIQIQVCQLCYRVNIGKDLAAAFWITSRKNSEKLGRPSKK